MSLSVTLPAYGGNRLQASTDFANCTLTVTISGQTLQNALPLSEHNTVENDYAAESE